MSPRTPARPVRSGARSAAGMLHRSSPRIGRRLTACPPCRPCPQGCSRPPPGAGGRSAAPPRPSAGREAPLRCAPSCAAPRRPLLPAPRCAPRCAAPRKGGDGRLRPQLPKKRSQRSPPRTDGLGVLALPFGPPLPSPGGRHPPGAGTSRAPFWGAGWASPRGGKAKQQCKHITKKKTSALYSERLFNPR